MSGTEAMQEGWSGDLDAPLERISRVATGDSEIRVLRGGRRVALGLPRDAKAARVVLDFYHPHRLKGRLFRMGGLAMVSLGLHRLLLSPRCGGSEIPAANWLVEAVKGGRVGFLGCNPVHGLRCIVGGLTEGRNGGPFVAKLGFDEGRKAIVREAGVLASLSASWEGVPESESFEEGEDWALLRLPHLGYAEPGGMNDPVVQELLEGWLGEESVELRDLVWVRELLAEAEAEGADPAWCESMRGRQVRRALVHGDFAVWNLRKLPGGPCAIDWEWAVEDGIGGIDLAYGLCQEELLVRRSGAGEAVERILDTADRNSWRGYLDSCGWSGAHEEWLKLGLLYGCLKAGVDGGPLLAELGIFLK